MDLLTNLRTTLRQVHRNPGFFAIVLAALALGIGANTAIFSAVEAVLLRPLPFFEPQRLVVVWEDVSSLGFPKNTPAPANYMDWRVQNQSFTDMAAIRHTGAGLTGDGVPESLRGRKTTPNFFDVLGVQPALGRPYTAEEDKARVKVVVISYGLWQRRYAGNPSVIGRGILLDGIQTTVIGVMPKDFFFRERNADYWAPMSMTPEEWARRATHFLTVVARLKPGVTLPAAQKDMERVAALLQTLQPDNLKVGAQVVAMQEDFVGDTKSGLWVLQIASVFVLLIVCSNLANLLLARSTSRRREIAVRVALGATQGQIAAQLLTESLLLSVTGGAMGLALGKMCWETFGSLVPEQVGSQGFQIDGQVLLFTAAISVAAGVLFGFAPALRAADVSVYEVLKEGGRSGESRSGLRLRDVLVVSQFALAFALLAGAGLMIQTLWNLRQQELGFRPDHLLTIGLGLPDKKYDTDEKTRGFQRDVLERVRAIRGTTAAGFGSDAPFMTEGNTNGYTVEGEPRPAPGEINDALYREVSPGYLGTVGATVLDGRLLQDSDRAGGLHVVVVNEFLAKRHWPGKRAIGKRIRFGDNEDETKNPWWTISGVVRDIRERGLLVEMKPAVYVPVLQVQKPDRYSTLVVRTSGEPNSLLKSIESAIWDVDSQQPVTRVRTMEEMIEMNVADRTRPMILLGVFAGLALVLACLGVYGVLAYGVAQRTREIGVRMALGAKPSDVTRMILRGGLKLSIPGLLVGGALAAGLGALLKSLLFGVTAAAPATYLSTAALLMLVAMAACIIPAHRASHLDPMVVLRDE